MWIWNKPAKRNRLYAVCQFIKMGYFLDF